MRIMLGSTGCQNELIEQLWLSLIIGILHRDEDSREQTQVEPARRNFLIALDVPASHRILEQLKGLTMRTLYDTL